MSQIPKVISDKIEAEYSLNHAFSGEAKLRIRREQYAAQFGFNLADAVGFAEWIAENTETQIGQDKERYYLYNDGIFYTTEQLYSLFLNSTHNATNNE